MKSRGSLVGAAALSLLFISVGGCSGTSRPPQPKPSPSPSGPTACQPVNLRAIVDQPVVLAAAPQPSASGLPRPTPRAGPQGSPSPTSRPARASLRVRLMTVSVPCDFEGTLTLAVLDSTGHTLGMAGNPSTSPVKGRVGGTKGPLTVSWTWEGACTPTGSYQYRVFGAGSPAAGGGALPKCPPGPSTSRLVP